MNIHRCYFDKNNTIINGNYLNSAKNQVTELVYGGEQKLFTKFIFKLDLEHLKNTITTKELTSDKIESHKLYLKNTINRSPVYMDERIPNNSVQERTSSFDLILFRINEEWDEGNGYDIVLDNTKLKNANTNGSNWFNKKTNQPWTTTGIYNNNNVEIIDRIHFDNGDEDFVVDMTNEINGIIYSGDTHHGYGIAFPMEYENLATEYIQSVFFHTKYTNTFFEPYLETKFNNTITDNRNCFHLNSLNRLYFFAKRGKNFYDITLKRVNIFDNYNNLIQVIDVSNIKKHSKGIYYIELELDDINNHDSVLYRDQWVFDIDNVQKEVTNSFYIIDENATEQFQLNNLSCINVFGLHNKEEIKKGTKLELDFNLKSLYDKLVNLCDYEFNYDLYVKQGKNNIYIVKDGAVNRAPNKNFINIDTKILVPNTYYLKINLKYKNENLNKTELIFNIVNT